MLCNRRGGCFAEGCYKWGCQCSPSGNSPGGCCGGGGPNNIFHLMNDPCHKKMVRNSMQLVYGAYYGGWNVPCGCPPNSTPCQLPPYIPPPQSQEPVRILFKCPTYCTPMPEPVMESGIC